MWSILPINIRGGGGGGGGKSRIKRQDRTFIMKGGQF